MWNTLSLFFFPPVQKMYSSISHMVFTWLEMFSHVFSRYWKPVVAGWVFHVENSLPAPLIWPAQLNHMCDLGGTELCFLLSSSPMAAASTAACILCLMSHQGRSLEARVEVSLWQKRRRQGKAWGGGREDLISSNMYRDSKLKWEETEEKQSSDWWNKNSHCCCCFLF